MRRFIQRLWREERGATAIEYGLILAMIALAVVGAMTLMSTNMNAEFTKIANKLS